MSLQQKKAGVALALLVIVICTGFALHLKPSRSASAAANEHIRCTPEKHVCVMKTMFGLDETAIPIKKSKYCGTAGGSKNVY